MPLVAALCKTARRGPTSAGAKLGRAIAIGARPIRRVQLHVSIALPVNICPPTWFAVMVTGPATAAVHVAVTCPEGEAERWTDGSLALQFELTRAAVATPTQPALI